MVLWLVTPVHGRLDLTRLCLEQRERVLCELAGLGIEAHQVIVGDDENLVTARELGFTVLVAPNVLGARLNAGFEYAFREGGADHVSYVDSDCWVLAGWLADPPAPGNVRTSRWITFVDGERIIPSECSPALGCAPSVVSYKALEPHGFRPFPNAAVRMLDTALEDALTLHLPYPEAFEFHPEDDPLRAVEFRGPWLEQMTPWQVLASDRYARPGPFEALATRYSADLVERMERLYLEHP